ncbi:MAG: hypothetical protein KVP17_001990 [Porospora cf. gigantea B]|uniref:uncharacterized protein n=1 Tax=Porospora cf. gigantea B TaxID=2853592 RepID=UPI003571ABD8|nr:MAG: hypothetical protein KVP17_001990 [Porospora cf. gigantea B]
MRLLESLLSGASSGSDVVLAVAVVVLFKAGYNIPTNPDGMPKELDFTLHRVIVSLDQEGVCQVSRIGNSTNWAIVLTMSSGESVSVTIDFPLGPFIRSSKDVMDLLRQKRHVNSMGDSIAAVFMPNKMSSERLTSPEQPSPSEPTNFDVEGSNAQTTFLGPPRPFLLDDRSGELVQGPPFRPDGMLIGPNHPDFAGRPGFPWGVPHPRGDPIHPFFGSSAPDPDHARAPPARHFTDFL